MTSSRKLKVIELFAGVGGFRIGLEGWKGKSSSSNYKDTILEIKKQLIEKFNLKS